MCTVHEYKSEIYMVDKAAIPKSDLKRLEDNFVFKLFKLL